MPDKINPIPAIFFEQEANDAFNNCISCRKDLRESGHHFMIEKAIRNFPELKAREVIIEYAMCMECALRARQQISEESKKSIDEFLQSDTVRMHSFQAMQQGMQHYGDATQICMITGEKMENVREFQIFAHCCNGSLLKDSQAFMLSGKALEMIAELLSEETKDELDRFQDEFLGLPPEWEDLINSRNLILF